jgi:GTPase
VGGGGRRGGGGRAAGPGRAPPPPTRRLVKLGDGQTVVVTDTVGFIHKLPPTLVAAFRATLEELDEADLLLHVVDISHRNAAQQTQVVEETLKELGLADKQRLLVFNKMDLVVEAQADVNSEIGELTDDEEMPGVLVSAVQGWGLDLLLEAIEEQLHTIGRTEVAGRSMVHYIG